jgi:hypothetical protein
VKHCAKLVKARVAAGMYSENPALETAIEDFDPAIALIEIAADPSNTAETRAACSAKLMPFWHKEQSLLVKEAGSGNAPVSISISVAPWASAKPPPAPALPPPPDETIIEPGTPQTNGTSPTPALSDRERLRRQVEAQRETVIVEAPVSPSEPVRVIGRVAQGKPYALNEDERQRIMETLGRGPQPQ